MARHSDSDREYLSITAEARHMKETIAGRKMRLAKHAENEVLGKGVSMWKVTDMTNRSLPGHKGQRQIQRQERNT